MELFDFIKSIDAYVKFSGSYSPKNTYVNVEICKNFSDLAASALCRKTKSNGLGWSLFGRSESPDFDEAMQDLADTIRGNILGFVNGGVLVFSFPVPEDLVHTKGYKPDKSDNDISWHEFASGNY